MDSFIPLALLASIISMQFNFEFAFKNIDDLRLKILQINTQNVQEVCEFAHARDASLSVMHHGVLVDPCTTSLKQYRRRYWRISGVLSFLPKPYFFIPIHLWLAPS